MEKATVTDLYSRLDFEHRHCIDSLMKMMLNRQTGKGAAAREGTITIKLGARAATPAGRAVKAVHLSNRA